MVTVYSYESKTQMMLLSAYLKEHKIRYKLVDLVTNTKERKRFQMLGINQAPIIEHNGHIISVGYKPSKLDVLLNK